MTQMLQCSACATSRGADPARMPDYVPTFHSDHISNLWLTGWGLSQITDTHLKDKTNLFALPPKTHELHVHFHRPINCHVGLGLNLRLVLRSEFTPGGISARSAFNWLCAPTVSTDEGLLGVVDTQDRLVPTLVSGEQENKAIVQVAVGDMHSTCVTRASYRDGLVYTWGTTSRINLVSLMSHMHT